MSTPAGLATPERGARHARVRDGLTAKKWRVAPMTIGAVRLTALFPYPRKGLPATGATGPSTAVLVCRRHRAWFTALVVALMSVEVLRKDGLAGHEHPAPGAAARCGAAQPLRHRRSGGRSASPDEPGPSGPPGPVSGPESGPEPERGTGPA